MHRSWKYRFSGKKVGYLESIVKFITINVLQFSRIREFCHDFNIGNFMNRGIPVVFESLVFHVPWNFGQVKTLETSRIVEFHRILRLRRGKQILGKQIRPNFLRSTSLQILANKSGCVQTNLLFFFYTPHLRRSRSVTWLPNFLGWVDLFTHGARLSRFARWAPLIR